LLGHRVTFRDERRSARDGLVLGRELCIDVSAGITAGWTVGMYGGVGPVATGRADPHAIIESTPYLERNPYILATRGTSQPAFKLSRATYSTPHVLLSPIAHFM
jgi:hypothetical protein